MKETIKCRKMVYTAGYPRSIHACLYKVKDYCPNCILPYCARHLSKHECDNVSFIRRNP